MSRRRPKASKFDDLAADHSPEDGSDPKDFHAKPWDQPKQAGRKAQQLCAQVREALIAATAACGDSAVQAARIGVVQPAPHSGRMRVVIYAPDIGRAAMLEALARASGHLRSEVARVISRKFAPELVFEVIEVQ